MAKRKPDEVIEFRISLQDREREMVDTLISALTFNRIATPTVEILKDATALSALALILEQLGVIDLIPNDIIGAVADGAFETVDDALDAIKNAVPDVPDAPNLNPWVPIWTWLKVSSRKLL
jgi:hypothetical protein